MCFEILKCENCSKIVEIVSNGDINFKSDICCCQRPMKKINKQLSEEGTDFVYNIVGDKLIVSVKSGKVGQLLIFESADRIGKKIIQESGSRFVDFPYIKGARIYYFDGEILNYIDIE